MLGDANDRKRGERLSGGAEKISRGASNCGGGFFRQVLGTGDDVRLMVLENRTPASCPTLSRMGETVALSVSLELRTKMRADDFDDITVRVVTDQKSALGDMMLVLGRDASERFSEHGDEGDARFPERVEHRDVGFGRQQVASNRSSSSLFGRIEISER